MSVQAGSRIGPYEIISRVGSGGMGEVWKARDPRLDRSVAIKVLPPELAQNTQLRLRFEREAKTISQLAHPHICTVFDVGDDYLVMEFLEGETLAERIARGPLPLSEVTRLGAQTADALDRAHRAGVVHRDLKPANVMVTRSGAKLLDFGLAKNAAPVVDLDGATVQKALTEEGTILGTFQYMAPEQLEGEEADPRTDIFALGALLYEMATGRRAFAGKTKTSLIAAIVGSDPTPISQLQPMTPPALEHVIRKCLAKDRDDRWQSAADIAEELRWIGESGVHATVASPIVARRRSREQIAWALAVLFLLTTLGSFWLLRAHRRAEKGPMAFEILPPRPLDPDGNVIAISPDGKQLVFETSDEHGTALYLRRFGSISAKRIDGTDRASKPFWSPDGQSIAFFADDKLLRVPVSGGSVQTICGSAYGVGGAWSSDGTIIFTPEWGKGLFRVPASGGTPRPLTHLDTAAGESVHAWPEFIDAKHFVFSVHSNPGEHGSIRLGSLDSEKTTEITAADALAGFADGRLFFVREGVVLAQKLDVAKASLTGESMTIAEPVAYMGDWGTAAVAVSEGVLAYVPTMGTRSVLRWYDRHGTPGAEVGTPDIWHHLALSPDATRLAAARLDYRTGAPDLWTIDLQRNVETRLTSGPTTEDEPEWSPDGKQIAFACDYQTGMFDLFEIAAGGAGTQRVIAHANLDIHPGGWSPDGRFIIASVTTGKRGIWAFDVRTGKGQPLVSTTTVNELEPRFSPDGKWFVYTSDDTGHAEIYVQPFPPTGDRWQISSAGGSQPAWRGNEIFYLDNGLVKATRVTPSGATLQVGETTSLFTAPHTRVLNDDTVYVVSPDGQHFLFRSALESDAPLTIHVIAPWTSSSSK